MDTSIHAQLVLKILNKFKSEERPSSAINDHFATIVDNLPRLEVNAYHEAIDIASAIYRKGTKVGYKNGVETTLQEIAELGQKLV